MPARRPPTSWKTNGASGPLYGTRPSTPSGTSLPPLPCRRPGGSGRCEPGHHRPERAHAAIGLEAPALVDDRLPGALGQAGEQAADHHAVGPGGERLGDVARVADAAVGDDRHPLPADALRRLVDRRDLRHAHARDDPRRADRPRPDADLDRVGPGVDQGPAPPPPSPRCRRSRRCANRFLISRTVSITLLECPWAESTTSTSTPALISDSARS